MLPFLAQTTGQFPAELSLRHQLRLTTCGLVLCLAWGKGATAAAPTRDAPLEGHQPTETRAADRAWHRLIVRTSTPPVIDGQLDDVAWAGALVIEDFRQVVPREGAKPSERTVLRLAYDDEFLYVSFRCHDAEADRIIATQMKRDASVGSDDHVNFVVDSFFDKRNGYFFEMNAVGARGDALVEDNDRFRRDWDGIWYGKANIDGNGWTAEMAIPFKTLSFNPDTTRWGFNAQRFIRRNNELIRWASPSQNTALESIADAGVIEGIEGIKQGKGIDIKPYALMTGKRDHEGDRNGLDFDAGLDVFYKFTPSLTLALTVNTDFAETEVDERQVNLTRFPLFFPEKRDFFLQDAGIFEFGGIRRNPLPFHSRRIGLGPTGEPIDILGGAKLTGRVNNLNLGLLDVQMKDTTDLGGKNLFVGRASLNVLEESTVGTIFTHGDPRTTDDNSVAGVDFNYRNSDFAGNRTVDGHLWGLTSNTTGADGGESAYGMKLGYPNDRVQWEIGYSQIDEHFNAALGFVPRRGIREWFGNWRHRWRPEDGRIRRIDSGVSGTLITNLDNDVESRGLNFNLLTVESESGDVLSASFNRQREVLDDAFEINDGTVIPAGDYKYDRYSATIRTSTGRPISVGATYGGGTFYTGTREDYRANVAYRASRHLFLGLEYEMNDVDLDEGDFITRIIRGRVNVFFTPDVSWTTFIQYDSLSESIGINSRVRWIVKPGSEFFFVLNQAVDRQDDSFRVRRTELTTKAGWTLRF